MANVLADREFNFDLARGSPPDCRPIEPLAGGAGWLAFERIIIPPFSGKLVLASTVNELGRGGAGMPRLAMVLDSERLLVIADDALQIVKLPDWKQRAVQGVADFVSAFECGVHRLAQGETGREPAPHAGSRSKRGRRRPGPRQPCLHA